MFYSSLVSTRYRMHTHVTAMHAGPVDNSCANRKMNNHTLITLDNNGSAVTASNVIVLNPVDDSVCTLQCDVGWYETPYGDAAPFMCAAQSADRTSREGITTYPISCTSSCVVSKVL